MKRLILPAACLVFLGLFLFASCEQEFDDSYQDPGTKQVFGIVSYFPLPGDAQVVRTSDMVIHFNEELDADSAIDSVTLMQVENGIESEVPIRIFVVGKNLYVKPRFNLLPALEFKMTILPKIRNITGQLAEIPEEGKVIEFATRPLRARSNAAPEVNTIDPPLESNLIYDFTTLRLYFTEPLKENTVIYGESIQLKNLKTNALVPASVFSRGNQVVIDPDGDLDSTSRYEVIVTPRILDRNAQKATAFRQQFTVLKSTPRKTLATMTCPNLGEHASQCAPASDPAKLPPSDFTGDPVNSMQVRSTLLGDHLFYVSAELLAELGSGEQHNSLVPIVLRKGQRLYGDGFDVKIGGEISMGFQSGELVFTLLTDAVGMIAGSNYVYGDAGSENVVVMNMDVALNSSGDEAIDAMLSQPILGVQFVGTTKVVGEKFVLDLSGFAEIMVQNEAMPITLSLRLETMDTMPDIVEDTKQPFIRSTTPTEDDADRVRLSEPIVVNFNEPVDPEDAISDVVVETAGGAAISGEIKVYGSKVIYTPEQPLLPNSEYVLIVKEGLRDLYGNGIKQDHIHKFITGADEADDRLNNPPIVTTVHPALYEDVIVPAQMPIIICFSQAINPNTILPGQNFKVLDVTDSAAGEPVLGSIDHRWDHFFFYPNELWKAGHKYRVEITDRIENIHGLQLDIDRDRNPGGNPDFEEIVMEFRATQENDWIWLLVKNVPLVDVNGSGYLDGNETGADENTIWLDFPFLNQTPAYLNGFFAAWVKGINYNDSDEPYLEVDVLDGTYLWATSIGVALPTQEKGLLDPFGRISIDVIQTGSANVTQNDDGTANMAVFLDNYISVENPTYQRYIDNDFSSLTEGRIYFSRDGRMMMSMTGLAQIEGKMDIPFTDILIPFVIPSYMSLRTVGEAVTSE